MKCYLGISDFLEEISSLFHSIIFLYFFALITEEGFLISPCYSLELCIQMLISFLFSFGPITSWQIDGETVETVLDFMFGGSKIPAGGDCSHEIRRRLLLGRKVMTYLDSILKSRGETERYKHLNAEFQRIARRHKKAFFSDQCKEIEENNRMGKTRDLFKKIRGRRRWHPTPVLLPGKSHGRRSLVGCCLWGR